MLGMLRLAVLTVALAWCVPAGADAGAEAGTDAGASLGASCNAASECGSGFCVEGVCCDAACGGQCETCLETPAGTCKPVAAGQIRPTQPCAGDMDECAGTCDGTHRTECAYPSGPVGSCAGDEACVKGTQQGSVCELGACVVAKSSCGLYRCGPNACLAICGADDDCVPGAACSAGSCVPATSSVCLDESTSLAPNGIASSCGAYPCDADAGTCAATCAADSDCVGDDPRCRGGHCVEAAGIRKVGLYDPEVCTCRAVGAGTRTRPALAFLLLAAGVLAVRRRRPPTSRAEPTLALLVLLAALLACGDPQRELPAYEVCTDVGYSIASRTQACTQDDELASERWSQYEERYDCNVETTDEIRELYVCPVELLRMDCEAFLGYGDDLDSLLSSISECTRVVKKNDGTLLVPTDPDAGATDAGEDVEDSAADVLDGGAE